MIKNHPLLYIYFFLITIPAFGSVVNTGHARENITALLLKSKECYINSEPDSSVFYLNTALQLAEKNNLYIEKINILIALADVYRRTNELNKAGVILDKIEAIILKKEPEYDEVLINFNVLKGKFCITTGNYKKAFSYLENARNISDKIYKDTVLIELEMNSGLAKFYHGEKKESVKYFDKVISAGNKYMKWNSYDMLYSLYYKICYLYNTGQQVSLQDVCKTADEICKRCSDTSSYNMGLLYELYGSIYVLYDKNTEAIIAFQNSKNNYKKRYNKWEDRINRITLNQAICFFNNGDFIKSEIYFNELLNIERVRHFLSKEALFSVYTYLGLCYKNLEEYQKALKIFTSGEKISGITKSELVYIYDNIATCYKNLGDYNSAEKYYLKTLKERNISDPDDVLNFAKTYHNFGDLYILKEQYRKAEDYLFKALINLKQLKEKGRSLALLYTTFGRLYFKTGNYEKAIDYYQRSMNEFCGSDFIPSKINTWKNAGITSAVDLLIAVKEKTRCYENISEITNNKEQKITNLINAVNCYKTAAWIIDTIRGGFQLERSKLFLANNEKDLYINAVKTIYNLYSLTGESIWIETAFEFSERSKSSLLLTNKMEKFWERNTGVSFKLLEKLKSLRKKIAQTEHLIHSIGESITSDTISRYKFSGMLFDLYDEQEALLTLIKIKYPSFFKISYKPKTISTPELLKKIKPGSDVIEYTLSGDELYTIVLSPGHSAMVRTSLPVNFTDDIYKFYNICSCFNTKSMGYNNFKEFSYVSNRLYKYLIEPVYSKLAGNRIIFIPDQELNYIPFEALVKRITKFNMADYSKPDYLIKHFAVSYSASATLLYLEKKTVTACKNLLAVSPCYERTNNNDKNNYRKLNPIIGTKEESVKLLKIIGGDLLSDNSATETEFKKSAGEYNILHLSMHCQYDSLCDFEPILLFGNSDSLNDGKLYGWEINNLGLNASLAVLSACNTGIGKLNKGEGFLNIARTFINAGCTSILMTLWPVGDLCSIQLVEIFYRNISERCPKDIALQKAKIEIISTGDPMKTHPYFWAGYVLEGDSEPIEIKSDNIVWVISVFCTVLVAVIFIAVRKKRKRKSKTDNNLIKFF